MTVYLHGTQRGYTVGVRRKGQRYDLQHFHPADWTPESVDAAYRRASLTAAGMESTLKRRPDLIVTAICRAIGN